MDENGQESSPLNASLAANANDELDVVNESPSDINELKDQSDALINESKRNPKKKNWFGLPGKDEKSEPKDDTKKGIVFSFKTQNENYNEKSPLNESLATNAGNKLDDKDQASEPKDDTKKGIVFSFKTRNENYNEKSPLNESLDENADNELDDKDKASETKDDTRKEFVFSFKTQNVNYNDKSPLNASLDESADNEVDAQDEGPSDGDKLEEQCNALFNETESKSEKKRDNSSKKERNNSKPKRNWMGLPNNDEISESKDATLKSTVFSFPSVRREVHEDVPDFKDDVGSSSSSSNENEGDSSSSSGDESDDEAEDPSNHFERENFPEIELTRNQSETKHIERNNNPLFPWNRRKNKREGKQGLLDNDAMDGDNNNSGSASEGIRNTNSINRAQKEPKKNNGNFLFGLLGNKQNQNKQNENQNEKLKSMKVATEDTKDQKDWKESLTSAIAVMALPELHAEPEEEEILGKYRKVKLDTSFDADDESNNGEINYKLEYEHLRDRVIDLERMINSSELKCQVWRERAHALEKEVERLRRGDDNESPSSDDDSSATTGKDTSEDEREVGWEENNVQEGTLLNLGASEEGTNLEVNQVSNGDKVEDLLEMNSSGADQKSGNDATEVLIDLGVDNANQEQTKTSPITDAPKREEKDEILIGVSGQGISDESSGDKVEDLLELNSSRVDQKSGNDATEVLIDLGGDNANQDQIETLPTTDSPKTEEKGEVLIDVSGQDISDSRTGSTPKDDLLIVISSGSESDSK